MNSNIEVTSNDPPKFPLNPEELLSTIARLAASSGDTFQVAVLASSENPTVYTKWINTDMFTAIFGGRGAKQSFKWVFSLHMQVPPWVYQQLEVGRKEHTDTNQIEASLIKYADKVLAFYNVTLHEIIITPSPTKDKDWREKAWAWLTGEHLNNQGRVRSDNIASRTQDGLLFRSKQEILLYQSLKSLGVSFAPLPVFIRGGEIYKRIEPDFVVIKNGILMIIEVDGDTYHQETPAEAHARTTMLVHEGAHVERIKASECDTPEKAATTAKKLITVIEKLKGSR